MGNVGGLLLGSFAIAFGLIPVATSLFKIRHWSDWNTRWPEARPAPVRVVLWAEALAHERKAFYWRAKPRSRRQAILWEAPPLLIGAAVVAMGFALVAVGPAGS